MPQMTQEQMNALQEKLSKMSPEELKAFQKKNCVFCQMAEGKASARKIYEDEICMAVLDIYPANPGHILLLPKEHYPIMPLIPEDELKHVFMVAKALSHVLLKTLKAGGTDIFIANGAVAGQRAQHFMVHIIPRKEGDGVALDLPVNKFSKTELSRVRQQLQAKIDRIFGKKKEEVILEEKPEIIKEFMEKLEEEKPEEEPAKKVKEKPAKKSKKAKKKGGKVSLDDIADLFK
jgi:histidine triad (HIT) family protein